jgi:hypothetical protein
MQKVARGAEFLRSIGVPNVDELPHETLVRAANGLSDGRATVAPSTELFATESARLDNERDQVKKAVGVLARNVVSLRAQKAGTNGETRVERSLLGDTIKQIHSQWLRSSGLAHDAMTATELQRKREWIRTVNDGVVAAKEVPSWLLV